NGDLASVQRWLAGLDQNGAEPSPPYHSRKEVFVDHERKELLAARLLIAQGNPEEALSALESLKAAAQEAGRCRSALAISLLIALAYRRCNRPKEAGQTLREAL